MKSARVDMQAGKGRWLQAHRTLRALLACALLLGAGGIAQAQQHDGRDYGGRDYGGPPPEHRVERFRLPQMERDPRQVERDPRQQEMPQRGYDDPRHVQQYQQAYPAQYPPQYQDPQRSRSGRMTADERAEMRRQINEAKDLYPQRR